MVFAKTHLQSSGSSTKFLGLCPWEPLGHPEEGKGRVEREWNGEGRREKRRGGEEREGPHLHSRRIDGPALTHCAMASETTVLVTSIHL